MSLFILRFSIAIGKLLKTKIKFLHMKKVNLLFVVIFLTFIIMNCSDTDSPGPDNGQKTFTLNDVSEGNGGVAIEGAVDKILTGPAYYYGIVSNFDYTGYSYRIDEPATTDYIIVTLKMVDDQNNGPVAGTYDIVYDENTVPTSNYANVGFRSNDTINVFFGTARITSGTVTVSNVDDKNIDVLIEADSAKDDFGRSSGSVNIRGAAKFRDN